MLSFQERNVSNNFSTTFYKFKVNIIYCIILYQYNIFNKRQI